MRRPVVERARRFMSIVRWLLWACFTTWIAASAHASEQGLPGTVALSPLPLDRTQAAPSLAVLGMSGSILTTGVLAFEGGYNPLDWSGVLQAVTLDANGMPADVVWNAGSMLTDATLTPPGSRTILTIRADSTGSLAGMAFEWGEAFDAFETKGLLSPEPGNVDGDSLAARVDYLRGVRTQELAGVMRTRSSLLGAIINSQAVYVSYPTGHYVDNWPTRINGVSVPAPEMAASAEPYEPFVAAHADRAPVLYIGANDGMLHAFNAPAPDCDVSNRCKAGADAGKELWAYVPRAVYAHLGHLTSRTDFRFQPTADATPVVRDVFFSQRGKHEWHTLLAGGLRLGGRGVYALDITRPSASEVFPESTVLWEFDADAPAGTSAAGTAYDPADLGYTYGQPAIARLANGRWAVLIPGGYFPDCNQPDKPAHCEEMAAQAPTHSSVLFVLDAQTGEVINELKTPTHLEGIASYGLTTPVLGDYRNDQIDDIAFAGDLAGNLWRFDLSAPSPADWVVTLAYKPAVQGTQPITVMPRLFPDPSTNRFIVVFGTGKYLGEVDNTADVPVQSVYGIRDEVDSSGRPMTVTHDSLQAQTLTQTTVANTLLRSLTSNAVPLKAGGWYVDLNVIAGERVVATPTALFNTGTVLVSTLIPGGDTPKGAVIAVDAATGGPCNAVSFDGVSYAGAMVNLPFSTGTLPTASSLGGGKLILPGMSLKGGNGDLKLPLSFDSPLWRRRSWSLLTPDY
jgi:Tfp pilus tip-associated adhesin PilY1